MFLLLVYRSMFFISCSFEHCRGDSPLRVHTCTIDRTISSRVPVTRYVSFWPTSLAACFQSSTMRHAYSDHQLRIRLVPSRTIGLSEGPAYFNARMLASCVWSWFCVRLDWLSCHIDGTSQRVAACTPLQGDRPWRNNENHEKQNHAMSMFWTPEGGPWGP